MQIFFTIHIIREDLHLILGLIAFHLGGKSNISVDNVLVKLTILRNIYLPAAYLYLLFVLHI